MSGDTFTELQSAEALNKVRPNAEQVSLLLRGKEDKPVFVEGSVFVGGNSASLAELTEIPNRQAHVKIGSRLLCHHRQSVPWQQWREHGEVQ